MTPTAPPPARETLHASAVAFEGRGVLILGAPGSGKSALALELMALGAELVADDRTEAWQAGDAVMLRAPDAIRGLIEARHVGLLRAPARPQAALHLAVDLDIAEAERLPPMRRRRLLGAEIALLHGVARGYFPAAIRQYIRHGRMETR